MPPVTEELLSEDLTRAMKSRDMPRVYVLRGLLTAIKNLKVEKRGGPIAAQDIVQIVRREIRKREEAEGFAAKAGREELVAQNRAERGMLEAYVPAQLDAEALESVVRGIVLSLPSPAIGPVMAALREQHAGHFDGKLASEIVKRVLAGASTA